MIHKYLFFIVSCQYDIWTWLELTRCNKHFHDLVIIWSEWRLTVIAATVRIASVDILDLSEVVIPAGVSTPRSGLGLRMVKE